MRRTNTQQYSVPEEFSAASNRLFRRKSKMTHMFEILARYHVFDPESLGNKCFEGVSFKLTSSWPPAREKGVASCSPDAASGGSGGSAGFAGVPRTYILCAGNCK